MYITQFMIIQTLSLSFINSWFLSSISFIMLSRRDGRARLLFFFFNRVNFAYLLFAIIKDCFEI